MNNPEASKDQVINEEAKHNLRKRLESVLGTMNRAVEALPEGQAKNDTIKARDEFQEFMNNEMEKFFDNIASGFKKVT